MEESIQISDITIVGALGDSVLLCTLNNEIANPEALAIQYDLGAGNFHIDNIQKFLKFTAFEGVDVKDDTLQDFFRNWIYRKLSSEKFIGSLIAMTTNEPTIQKAYLLGLVSEDDIEKAWKKQPIGTVTTRKDGQQYRKVAETGNMDQDWKLVVKDKAESGEPQKEGNKSTSEVKGGNGKVSKEDLLNHAKNTSETALQAAVKGSADSEVRKIAHEELDRRSKEEAIQEEKEGAKPVEKKKQVVPEKKDNKIEKLKFNLSEKFKELTQELINFTDYENYEKLKELQTKQKDVSRYLQHLENLKETDLDKSSELLKNNITFKGDIKDLFGDGKILHLDVKSRAKGTQAIVVFEDGFSERFFDKNGEFVEMTHFYLNPTLEKGKGKGSEIFTNQVEQFKKLGFKKLKTTTGDIAGMNGYYTWARLGYEFSDDFEKNAFLDMMNFEEDEEIKKATSLQELLVTKKGQDWWKENGFAFTGEFDLSDDSLSMNILKNYKK